MKKSLDSFGGSATSAAAAGGDDDDDDIDLFGSDDDDEDDAMEAIRQQRLKAYAEKKAKSELRFD